jgi:hypothetical protein
MTDWLVPGFTEIRELGVGTTGRTALARDDETGDLVAIKYLSAQLTDDTAVAERIRREAALVTGVRDPNVVRIDAVLDSPDGGDVALVMEAVDGPTLRALLAARRPLPEAALALLRGSLLGLAVLHDQGVMHRDVKPDNVLIDAARQGKLINIGIPVPAGEDAAEGTAAYRAPELWHGRPASPASDTYAAAVTFVECLTGVAPFRADSTAELRALHESAPPPLDGVPEPLRPLLERALSKDPRKRYSDARAFATDLETAAAAVYGPGWLEQGVLALTDAAAVMTSPLLPDAGTGVATRRPGWAHLRTRRRKVLAAVAGAVVVLLLALLLMDGGSGAPSVVRKPFDQALAALAKSPGVRYQDQKSYFTYFDVTVTATGERHGTMGSSKDASGDSDQAFVTIGGRDYTSWKNDPELRGWRYDPGDDEKNTGPALKPYLTPAKLAATLTKALREKPRLPEAGDKEAAAVTVDGTRAWKADTVNGYIYVTQSAPYRVLRWEPPGVNTLHGTLKGATAMPQLPRSVEAETPLADSRGMDITPVTDAGPLYATVIQNTKDLADATADTVQIVQQNGGASAVRCSSSGCHVNVAFSGPVYNATSKAYALDTVYIELAVGSITTGGQQVGGCTSGRQPYELTGKTLTGELTCDNPDAGAAYDAASAQNQDRANASGHSSFWDVADDIDLVVHPLSTAEVDRLVARAQQELQSLD